MSRTIEQVLADPIYQALYPGKQFLEARFLPPMLNPFACYFINVAGLISYKALPHIKAVPAVQMMKEDFRAGRYEGVHTIVVDSSGNTAHSVARLAQAFGMEVKVVLSADVPGSKVGVLAALSTVEFIMVSSGKSVSERAKEEGNKPGHYHLNQYAHLGNMNAHEAFTGPEIVRSLHGNVGVVAIAMGSGGTAGGVGRFFKKHYPGTIVLGVRPKFGEQVPGARDSKRMEEVVTLDWKPHVDAVAEVPRKDAFIATRQLWSAMEPQPGPTSGLAYKGLIEYLSSLNEKLLEKLRGKNVAFICPDAATLYSDIIIAELDTGQGVIPA